MDTPIPKKKRCANHQIWLVILSSLVSCIILLLCFDYSALTTTEDRSLGLINSDRNADTTQESESSHNSFGTPISTAETKPTAISTDSCSGRYIYMHHLPERFNQQLLDNCESITPGAERNMCPYLVNGGLGRGLEDSQGVLLNRSWYLTNQFLLEVIFHEKMKRYKCLTRNSSLASAVYVPFYAGLDISRYLWGSHNISVRDRSGLDLVKWLVRKPEWRMMWGRDHFLVAGRVSWDFRRQTDNESDWGSKTRFLPESKNMSMLAIEASSWNNDYAIPYPTCFHPSKDSEVIEWQEKMRKRKRKYLFSFAGAPRPNLRESIRGKVIEECQGSGKLCKLLECAYGPDRAITCDNPANVMRLFQDSVYCLQAGGDSYTRRSIFDSILAGCIPVFFQPGTAYAQYKWHLPKNYSSYSVFIPVKDVKDWKPGINETLLRIGEDRVRAMREEVIRLIPNVMYADPRSRLKIFEDAFDLAVKGILERIERVRQTTKERMDPSTGFADSDGYKYTFSGYVGET